MGGVNLLTVDSGIHAQTTHGKRCQEVYDVPDVDGDLEGAAAEEAADPALDRGLVSGRPGRWRDRSPRRVGRMAFFWMSIAQGEQRGQRVRQVQQHRGGHDTDEAKVVRDGGRDDEGDDPPDGDDGGVDELAARGDEGRSLEEVHEDVVVEDLDADVAVQTGGDEASHEGDACCPPSASRRCSRPGS